MAEHWTIEQQEEGPSSAPLLPSEQARADPIGLAIQIAAPAAKQCSHQGSVVQPGLAQPPRDLEPARTAQAPLLLWGVDATSARLLNHSIAARQAGS